MLFLHLVFTRQARLAPGKGVQNKSIPCGAVISLSHSLFTGYYSLSLQSIRSGLAFFPLLGGSEEGFEASSARRTTTFFFNLIPEKGTLRYMNNDVLGQASSDVLEEP